MNLPKRKDGTSSQVLGLYPPDLIPLKIINGLDISHTIRRLRLAFLVVSLISWFLSRPRYVDHKYFILAYCGGDDYAAMDQRLLTRQIFKPFSAGLVIDLQLLF